MLSMLCEGFESNYTALEREGWKTILSPLLVVFLFGSIFPIIGVPILYREMFILSISSLTKLVFGLILMLITF